MDFRKADPTYTDFKPKTAEEAIDKFYRHKRLGVPPHLWPEVFVECAASLPNKEIDKFEAWLVNPSGEPTGTELKEIDAANEKLRKLLLAEATMRDMRIDEGDEKVDQGLSASMSELTILEDYNMVTT